MTKQENDALTSLGEAVEHLTSVITALTKETDAITSLETIVRAQTEATIALSTEQAELSKAIRSLLDGQPSTTDEVMSQSDSTTSPVIGCEHTNVQFIKRDTDNPQAKWYYCRDCGNEVMLIDEQPDREIGV